VSARRVFASALCGALVVAFAAPALGQAETKKAPPAGKDTHAPQQPGAAPAAPSAPAADPNGPRMVLPEEKKDVGTVAKGDVIKQIYVVKNAGKSDLHITDVKPSCGCTVPEYDKVIKPGAEGKITLNVETKNFQGPISKTALVVTDDPTTPQMTIFLTANVKPFIEALPFGFFRVQALTGETASAELFLVSDEPDFKPTKAEVDAPYLKVSLVPAAEKERIAGRNPNQYKVTLTAEPNAPEGLLGGHVKVTTGIKKQPEFDVAISGFVKPTVSVTPSSVNFGNFDPKGEPVKRNITLVSNDAKNDAFAVTKAQSSVAGISAEIVPLEKGRVQVVLTVDQKMKKGIFEGDVTIHTNQVKRGEIKLPIKGVIL
jgi:hypothetical protein